MIRHNTFQVVYHIVNTLLQTKLLLIVGYFTLFFEEENFTDRIMVTLTVLLVMATLMGIIQSVSEPSLIKYSI